MQTVVLCGGQGTRAYPHTRSVPKPLLEVAGEPVLAHVMRIYADQGLTDFVLASGYLHEAIVDFAHSLPRSWNVEVVDTGLRTNTGGRVRACRHLLDGRFMATYADGVADIDLHALLARHEAHEGAATLTTVALPSPYGTIDSTDADRVTRFREKPRLSDHHINGGFFVFEQQAFDHWAGEDLENDVLPALADAGELYAYRHEGFWQSMDTYKDALALSALAEAADGPPWARTPGPPRRPVAAGNRGTAFRS